MKTAAKIGALLIVGLLTAGVGYPLLHEGGHCLAALAVGGEVEEVQLLPTASVLCRMPSGDGEMAAVGLGGLLLPPIVAALLPHRRFWCWYLRFILLSVCLLSLAFSLVAVGCYGAGHPLPQDDVTQILRYAPQASPYLCMLLAGMLAAVTLWWVRARPLSRWIAFLCQ